MWIAEVIALGLGVGVLVGLLGIGGGVVVVPGMVYLFKMDQHVAQGTSLFLQLAPVGLGALYLYWKRKHVDVRVGLVCIVGILLGGYAGSFLALKVSTKNLKGLFGMFLIVAAAMLWRQARAENAPEKPNV